MKEAMEEIQEIEVTAPDSCKKCLHSSFIYDRINIRKRIWRNWQTR